MLSPMMQHYLETKKENPDCLLFYRLGDFYEMFFDDAVTVSRELDLVLTGKDCGLEERAPMCGVPYHAVDVYLNKLVEKGYKVAIAEQMEDPKLAKGLVKREDIRVVTPGTVLDPTSLDETKNNYLMSIVCMEDRFGFAAADITTISAEISGLPQCTPKSSMVIPAVKSDDIDTTRSIGINLPRKSCNSESPDTWSFLPI